MFLWQILSSLRVPDKNKQVADVVLGFDKLADWETKNGPYLGAVVGRVGNRIAKGKFTLNGKQYTLATNNGANHLHGGLRGFDKVCAHAGEKRMLQYLTPLTCSSLVQHRSKCGSPPWTAKSCN